MELINSGTFESLPVGALATNASMAEDSDGSYDLSDEEDDPPSSCIGVKTKEAAKKFSGMLGQWLLFERPAQDAQPSKTCCKRDLATLELDVAAPQVTGKRQRKPVALYEAGSAACFVRTKAAAEESRAPAVTQRGPASPPTTLWARTDRERARKQAMKHCPVNTKRKEGNAMQKAHGQQIADLVGKLEEEEEFSWRQRRKLVIKAFVTAVAFGYQKLVAYHITTFACGVGARSVQDWVAKWRKSPDGFEQEFKWGKNSGAVSILMEEDVIAASKQWWRENAPRKGVRIASLVPSLTSFFFQVELACESLTSIAICVGLKRSLASCRDLTYQILTRRRCIARNHCASTLTFWASQSLTVKQGRSMMTTRAKRIAEIAMKGFCPHILICSLRESPP